MNEGAQPKVAPDLRVACVAALLSAGASALVAWAVHRNGLGLSFDAWSYWESSVSLLAGGGPRYLGGEAMPWWPPLFPAYLAAVQAVAGISGASLARALEFLAAAGTLAWLRLSPSVARGMVAAPLLAAVALAAYFGSASHALLSETLMLPLLAVAIARFDEIGRTVGSTARQIGLTVITIAAGLLTRHSFAVFLPGLLVLALLVAADGRPRLRTLTRALLASLLGFSSYLAIRLWLGQSGSHPLERFDAGVFVTELQLAGADLARQVAPGALGPLMLTAILGTAIIFCIERPVVGDADGRHPHRFVAGCVACMLAGILGQAALLALVRSSVTESLVGRYLWFATPLAVTIATVVATSARARGTRLAGLLTLLLFATVETRRAGYWVLHPEPAESASLLRPQWTLRTDHPCDTGASVRLADGRELVAPPAFPWLERCREREAPTLLQRPPEPDVEP